MANGALVEIDDKFLSDIVNAVAAGAVSNKAISRKIGVPYTVFKNYRYPPNDRTNPEYYVKTKEDIEYAVALGRQRLKDDIQLQSQVSLNKLITGYSYKEKREEYKVDSLADSDVMVLTKKVTTTKRVPPNVNAVIFGIINTDGNYSEKGPEVVNPVELDNIIEIGYDDEKKPEIEDAEWEEWEGDDEK